MGILQSIIGDISKFGQFGAFVTWWATVYLSVQLSRYRDEPEMPAFRRRYEIGMLVFLGFLALATGTGLLARWLGGQL